MRVSGSLFSWPGSSSANLDSLNRLDVDRIHIDVFDDDTVVPEVNFSESSIQAELHIVSSLPERFLDAIARLRIGRVLFQFENLPEGWQLPEIPGAKIGMAILPETDLEALAEYIDRLDYLCVMATVPGISGKPFNIKAFDQISRLRQKWPTVPVHVDGGVDNSLIPVLALCGVQEVVLGSFLANSDSQTRVILQARFGSLASGSVRTAMVPLHASPVLTLSRAATLGDVAQVLESNRRGFVLLCEESGECSGVITDGDLRRATLRNNESDSSTLLSELMPELSHFVSVSPHASLLDAFEASTKSKNNGRSITFVPVVSEDNKLQGVLDFKRLREELG